ncbi:MAG TPA: S9 family peptidase [Rhizomicrobium sp.]|nr:S9 family peptidase [Rhizomicrobium sp.]
MKKSIVLVLAALAAVPAMAAGQRVLTPEDIFQVRDVGDPQVAPAGDWVAYTVRQLNEKDDKSETHIWMARVDGSRTIQLTARAKESESAPRFSPDGHYIAFLSGRTDDNKNDQLWLMDRAGGEAQKITDFKGGVDDYAWSPDGKHIALIVEDEDKSDGDDKDKTPKPIVIDRFRFMQDVSGYLTTRRNHLYLLDVASKTSDILTPGDYYEGMPSWSPDSQSILFISKRHPHFDRDNNWGLFVIAAQKGAQPKQIVDHVAGGDDPDGPNGNEYAQFSPDGKTIAYVQAGDPRLIEYAVNHLMTAPASGGAPKSLLPNLDRNVGAPLWSADGKTISFLVEDDRTEYLARVAASGGALQRIAGARDSISDYSVAHGRFAYLLSNPTMPPEVFVTDPSGPRQISRQNDWLKDVKLAPVQEIAFKSKDGTEVHGFLLKPPGVTGGHLPTILRIHGGPQSQFALSFNFEWQLIAGHSYAVVAANPRGSTGRGQAYAAAIFANWGGPDAQDELAAVDYAVKAGVADPNRLGVGGWSYGGMLTNYVIASDTRFKAATSGASIADILGGYGNDQYAYDYERELGQPWKNTAVWMKISYPFLHADRIKTPTLFLGGTADMNVPLHNGEQMYQALKSMGIDTQLIVYPGQFHGLTKPSYLKDRYQRYLAWYDAHLKGKHG